MLVREGVWDVVFKQLEDDPDTFEYSAYLSEKISWRAQDFLGRGSFVVVRKGEK